MNQKETYATTAKRVLIALVTCTSIVTFVMGIPMASYWFVPGNMRLPNIGLWIATGLGLYALLFVSVFLAFVVFACIPWLALHRLGLRSWWIAPCAGFAVLFSFWFWVSWYSGTEYSSYGRPTTFVHYRMTEENLSNTWMYSFLLGLIGAWFGWLLWRIAYRKV